MRPFLEVIKLCECGCGREVKPGRRFVHGHNGRGDIERAKKIGKAFKKLWKDPRYRQKVINSRIGHIVLKKTRNKIAESKRGVPLSEEHIKNLSLSHIGNRQTEKSKRKISFALTGVKKSKEMRRKLSLAKKKEFEDPRNCTNWQGGLSYEPYCQAWKDKEYKEDIKARDSYKCQNLNCNNVTDLMIHHIDYNKKNCGPFNLITLCRSCNAKANFSRDCWKDLYQQIIINKYKKAA